MQNRVATLTKSTLGPLAFLLCRAVILLDGKMSEVHLARRDGSKVTCPKGATMHSVRFKTRKCGNKFHGFR